MSTWLDTITGPLNAASQTIQKAVEIRDAVKFGEEAGKLHAQILAAMTGAIAAKTNEAALLDEIGDLKKEVAVLKAWEAEKDRYALERLPPNVFVYSLKPSMAGGEPEHSICKTCYQRGKKHILDSDEPYRGVYHLTCHECNTILQIGRLIPEPPEQYDPFSGYGA